MRRASASPMPLDAPVTSAIGCAMARPLSLARGALTAYGRPAMTGRAMAHLTQPEFGEAVRALAAHFGIERLRDRLARMNAFTSRRGLGSASARADRLRLLTGGLRRQAPA